MRAVLRAGHVATSAFQPRGLRPRSSPLPLPRPTAGGYSSRSKPSRVGMSSSSRSRRASAPRRLTISRRGQPRRSAPRKCLRMFGYSALVNTSRCTPRGFVHASGFRPSSSPPPPRAAGLGRARARQVVAVDAVAVAVARVGGLLGGFLVGVVRACRGGLRDRRGRGRSSARAGLRGTDARGKERRRRS